MSVLRHRGPLGPRREHRAEGGGHAVEAPVLERQLLDVRLVPRRRLEELRKLPIASEAPGGADAALDLLGVGGDAASLGGRKGLALEAGEREVGRFSSAAIDSANHDPAAGIESHPEGFVLP